jgi:hypothetical protein
MSQSQSIIYKLGAAVLAEILDSDSSDGEEETKLLHHQKKKRRARLLNAQTALQSLLYVCYYLKLTDACMEPFSTTSIFYDSSHLGKAFWVYSDSPIQCLFIFPKDMTEYKSDDGKSHEMQEGLGSMMFAFSPWAHYWVHSV